MSLQKPTLLLVVDEEDQWKAVPLKQATCPRPTVRTLKSVPLSLDSECKYESLRATLILQRTENYTLDTTAKFESFRGLRLLPNLDDNDFIELFASKENADMEFYCTRDKNDT